MGEGKLKWEGKRERERQGRRGEEGGLAAAVVVIVDSGR